jgi:hypothetical protein
VVEIRRNEVRWSEVVERVAVLEYSYCTSIAHSHVRTFIDEMADLVGARALRRAYSVLSQRGLEP